MSRNTIAVGVQPLTVLTALLNSLGASLFLDYRSGVTPDTGSGFSWAPIISATAFTRATGATCPTKAADGVAFARASSQFCSGANLNTYVTTTAGTLIVILKPNASDSNLAPNNLNNSGVVCAASGQNLGITYRSSPAAQLATQNGGGAVVLEKAMTNGVLQCWEASWSTSDNFLRLRVAGTDATPATQTALGAISVATRIGQNLAAGDYFDGKIQGVIAFASQVISSPLRAAISAAYSGIAT